MPRIGRVHFGKNLRNRLAQLRGKPRTNLAQVSVGHFPLLSAQLHLTGDTVLRRTSETKLLNMS